MDTLHPHAMRPGERGPFALTVLNSSGKNVSVVDTVVAKAMQQLLGTAQLSKGSVLKIVGLQNRL